ncbi:MAG: ribbon-helix-helix protein, CopG family [Planctomycetes bacterium]|nr:ribbon-helix-helix protein, CopG family [Planctomycetota bacterium]
MSNLTIAVDDDLLHRAREHARERGTSLQALLRDYLARIAGERSPVAEASELLDLMESAGGRSGGRLFRRDDAYEDRL